MWNMCISWFGRCQWGCSESFDWLKKIIHRAMPCCDLLFTRHIPHTKIHLRPHLCMCMFFRNLCVCECVLPHTVDAYISCRVGCSFSSLIFWKPTLECCSSSLITVQTRTHRSEFTWRNEDAVKAYKSLPAYNAGSKPGLSPEAVRLQDLQKEGDRGEKRQTGTAHRVFYHIVTSHLSIGGNPTPNETIHKSDNIGKGNKKGGGGEGGTQKKDRGSRQKHESTSERRWGGRVRKTVGLKTKVETWDMRKELKMRKTGRAECVQKKEYEGLRGSHEIIHLSLAVSVCLIRSRCCNATVSSLHRLSSSTLTVMIQKTKGYKKNKQVNKHLMNIVTHKKRPE